MISILISHNKKTNETGVISIITVVLLAMVLTLITTAFVKSATSNQRQALDTQLSTQAFYAAESGINDAISILKNNLADPTTDMNTENCTTFLSVIQNNTDLLGSNPDKLESNSNIQYTCVLVNNKQSVLEVTEGDSAIFKIQADDSSVIDQLSISWGAGRTVPTGTAAELYDQSSWRKENGQDKDRVALIRLTFYYPSSLDRANLVSDQKTFFLRPVRALGASEINVSSSNDAAVIGVNCQINNGPCSLKLMGIASLTGNNIDNFYIRMTAIYDTFDTSGASIMAYNSGGIQKNLIGAQYSIDVTGRANDVYRRVKIRIPITPQDFPDAVVKSASDLCKQFVVWPGGSSDEAGCSF
jgi:Tfp pilus assembly protein PilX